MTVADVLLILTVVFLVGHLLADTRSLVHMRHHKKDWLTLAGMAALGGHLVLDFI